MTEAGEVRTLRLAMAGMALVVFTATVLLHEGLGHGGACLATGGKPLVWGAFYFDCASSDLAAERWVSAAGAVVNVLTAAVALLAARFAKRTGPRLFLWLLFTVSWFQGSGYLLFSGVAGIGDWGPDGVLKGVRNAGLWRAAEAVLGAALYGGGGVFAARRLEAILGGTPERNALARKLSWTAYFTGGVFALLVGLLNPIGLFIVLASAVASTFGGASGLMWLVRTAPRKGGEPSLDPVKAKAWLAAGLVLALAFAATLGRSIHFG